MTILQALDSYYHRLDGVAKPGWSPIKFGWCLILNRLGQVVDVQDLRDLSGKKPRLKEYIIPWSNEAADRTSGIAANFLADKIAYALGRTVGDGKRTAQEHSDFVEMHLNRLNGIDDEGLFALRKFLKDWKPDRLESLPGFTTEMLGANIMFRLEGDFQFIHERPAARDLVEEIKQADSKTEGMVCLVTGNRGPIALKHPKIKGVETDSPPPGGGFKLVSFNLDAFTSLGKEQGANAPTSEAAAFRYGAALNHLLTRDGPNRIRRPIGDATVVFWADASDAKAAEAADALFASWLTGDITDEEEARKVREQMEAVAKGRPVAELKPEIEPGTRFHVLGLSPNAARLSVRFWLTDDLDQFARRLAGHHADLQMKPAPIGWGAAPSVNRLLARTTALQEKFDNIPPLLAGEVMRAILSGTRYPQSLLAAAIMRLRAGEPKTQDGRPGDIGWHAAVIRAVLQRDVRLSDRKDDVPMSLDKESRNEAYRLGRLFAALEHVQEQAIDGIKAGIRSRFLASASSAPASVFPTLLRLSQHHITTLASQDKGGSASFHDKQIQEIIDDVPGDFPRSLKLADQGRFYIGYYHQRAERFRKRDGKDGPDIKENNDGE